MKRCPICSRTYSDDTFSFCLQDGSLLSASLDDNETVIKQKSFNSYPKAFDSNQTAVLEIDEPVIAIKINQQYPYVKNAEDLYQCTRGLWRLSRERAAKAQYAFAVYKGEIVEVYEINQWNRADDQSIQYWIERLKSQGREVDVSGNDKRFQFIGKVAPTEIRNKYVGRQMPGVQGQNPIQYFNC